MTQNELIEMIGEAGGYGHNTCEQNEKSFYPFMERFAKLVAEKEREACAEMCKKHADVYGAFEPTPSFQAAWAACIDLRDQIRARGEA